jgi:phosphomannomutase
MSLIRKYTHKYDIRGSISSRFGPNESYSVGRGFASIIRKKKLPNSIAVGFDIRESSMDMANNLIRGLMDSGIDVIEIGRCTTPMVRFASIAYKVAGSIMVTASHNNLWDNGFKFTLERRPFFDHSLQELCDIIEREDYVDGSGSLLPVELKELYKDSILKRISISDNVRVVWIARNQVIAYLLEDLLQRVPGHHLIDSNPRDAKYFKHDIVFDFDTDADRMSMLDHLGNHWHGDETLAVFALNMKKYTNNLNVVFDLKSSRVLMKWLEAQDIHCHTSRMGSCFIDRKMRELRADLGGETSGHFLFRDYHELSDDGIYSALRMLHCLSEMSLNLQEVRAMLPTLYISKSIKISCGENNKNDLFEKLLSYVKQENLVIDENAEGAIIVRQTEGWYIIRISETENALSVRCEGYNKNGLNLIQDKIEETLSVVGLSLW